MMETIQRSSSTPYTMTLAMLSNTATPYRIDIILILSMMKVVTLLELLKMFIP